MRGMESRKNVRRLPARQRVRRLRGGVFGAPPAGEIHLPEPQVGRRVAQWSDEGFLQNDGDGIHHGPAKPNFGDGISGSISGLKIIERSDRENLRKYIADLRRFTVETAQP